MGGFRGRGGKCVNKGKHGEYRNQVCTGLGKVLHKFDIVVYDVVTYPHKCFQATVREAIYSSF